ncbi:GIY-YIG nuclease family protein [Psychroflexus maritimus]|uniref:GIY-YIG nuclease family protein n=1 Tax=Psychroflexus maritimus TaxID=2714865 RepID=A0A967AFZ3_9FLAO|nr:GIY-YIG nuclease family protein [Psychroflexus maritimus]NGZ89806.1 GIY-YIG nuclease family protein [Psychroflexus maritimus]
MKRTHHTYYVYILCNKPKGVLYIGVTAGIHGRLERHKLGEGSKFTKKYNVTHLVYYEEFQYIIDAIAREKKLKKWKRAWKIALIEEENPEWKDLITV